MRKGDALLAGISVHRPINRLARQSVHYRTETGWPRRALVLSCRSCERPEVLVRCAIERSDSSCRTSVGDSFKTETRCGKCNCRTFGCAGSSVISAAASFKTEARHRTPNGPGYQNRRTFNSHGGKRRKLARDTLSTISSVAGAAKTSEIVFRTTRSRGPVSRIRLVEQLTPEHGSSRQRSKVTLAVLATNSLPRISRNAHESTIAGRNGQLIRQEPVPRIRCNLIIIMLPYRVNSRIQSEDSICYENTTKVNKKSTGMRSIIL
jgi:hypothetical protein